MKSIFMKLIKLIKQEMVLFVACVLAVISVFMVPPDREYLGYIDYRVIVLLFCLMTVMQGFMSTGLFSKMAGLLLSRVKSFRPLMIVLVMLCFVCSMWITNDVALITFVPFTILVLKIAKLENEMIPIIVLQTIAANLGSMATPVGNPQNLYIYSVSNMGIGEFLNEMIPLSLISLLMILAVCFLLKNYEVNIRADLNIDVNENENANINANENKSESGIKNGNAGKGALYENIVLTALFLLSILSVLRIVSWKILLIAVILGCVFISILWKEKFLPLKADFALLLTFAAFFIFIGNMSRVGYVSNLISKIMAGRELIVSFACSQVISNVPAAILLSGFTNNYGKLLAGVNIGGLGTLIASLASLISFKFFAKQSSINKNVGTKGKFILHFTVLNVAMASVLIIFDVIIK